MLLFAKLNHTINSLPILPFLYSQFMYFWIYLLLTQCMLNSVGLRQFKMGLVHEETQAE